MNQKIEHNGIITTKIDSGYRVHIVQVSACSGCHAKGACSAADMDDKFIDVETNLQNLQPGDMVKLTGATSMGLFAVLLAFVLPFVLILTSLLVLVNFTSNESLSGTLSLAILVPYFVILSVFNKKLKRKLHFDLVKLN